VMLFNILPSDECQMSLFDTEDDKKNQAAIEWMDKINARFGNDSVKFASCGTQKHWQMRSEFRSPRFTTQWTELLEVD